MSRLQQDVFTTLRDTYASMTHLEQYIADFFLRQPTQTDFSLKQVTAQLHVSEASLTRFAQRCRFKGYREFVYQYTRDVAAQESENSFTAMTQQVISTYQTLFAQTLQLVDEAQIRKVAEWMNQSDRVYVCGNGSSGIAAREFKLRFMRLGLPVEALDDYLLMQMSAALAKPKTLIIGMSISGKTQEILKSLRLAKAKSARVVLITANADKTLQAEFDEVIHVASDKLLATGISISPQFPLLMLTDILFSYYLSTDILEKTAMHQRTLQAMQASKEGTRETKKDEAIE